MLIQFKIQGGIAFFPNLNRPFTIDTSQLDPEKAEHLDLLINEAHFFNLPTQMKKARVEGADYQTYIIRIENEGHTHCIQVTDAVDNTTLQDLIDYLRDIVQSLQ